MKKYILNIDKTMKKYIFVLVASVMAITATAQSLTPQEEREFYQKAYSLIVDYAQSATMANEQQQYVFLKLFPSGSTSIYNDLMGLAYAPTLTVEDYIKVLSKARTVDVEVKNIKKGQINDVGDSWQLPITFEKAISFDNNCGTHFDSREFFGKDYRLQAFIMKEKSTDQYYIAALTAAEDGALEFPEDYTVLMKHDDRDINLEVNGKLAKFNSYDQMLLGPAPSITYLKNSVEKKSWYSSGETPCDNKIVADYIDKSWRLRPNVGFLGKINQISGAPDDGKQSPEMSFGLDVGYVFPSKSRLFVGLFAGGGLSMNNYKMAMPTGGGYHSNNQKDIDGDLYQRNYELREKGMTQELKATDFHGQVYFDLEYKIAGSFSLFSDLGIKANLHSSGKFSGEIDSYKTSGIYSQYDNLTIEDIEILGFRDWAPNTNIKIDESDVSSSTAFDVFGGLGIRFNVTKSLAFDIGGQFLMGLTNSWRSSQKNDDFGHFDNNEDSFYSFVRNSDGIKHKGGKLTASLIYKF